MRPRTCFERVLVSSCLCPIIQCARHFGLRIGALSHMMRMGRPSLQIGWATCSPAPRPRSRLRTLTRSTRIASSSWKGRWIQRQLFGRVNPDQWSAPVAARARTARDPRRLLRTDAPASRHVQKLDSRSRVSWCSTSNLTQQNYPRPQIHLAVSFPREAIATFSTMGPNIPVLL